MVMFFFFFFRSTVDFQNSLRITIDDSIDDEDGSRYDV